METLNKLYLHPNWQKQISRQNQLIIKSTTCHNMSSACHRPSLSGQLKHLILFFPLLPTHYGPFQMVTLHGKLTHHKFVAAEPKKFTLAGRQKFERIKKFV